MPRIAFGVGDHFSLVDNGPLLSHSQEDDSLPAEFAASPRPRQPFASSYGGGGVPGSPSGGGDLDVYLDNEWIEVLVGGGIGLKTMQIPLNTYTNVQLAAAITAQLVAVAHPDFFCDLVDPVVDTRFRIGNPTVDFSLLSKTGVHGSDNAGDDISTEIGFSVASDHSTGGLPGVIIADAERHSTHTWIAYDNQHKTDNPTSIIAILRTSGIATTSDVKAYGNAVPFGLGLSRGVLEATADIIVPLSPQGADPNNPIQFAAIDPAGAFGRLRYWAFSWRHVDADPVHDVGILRWPTIVQGASPGFHVRELRGHGQRDLSRPIGVDRYYGLELAKFWRIPLAFDQWPILDWRAVGHVLRRAPKTQPVVVIVNYDDIVAGTALAEDEAENGFLMLASIADTGEDSMTGALSAYVDAEMLFEQLR